jgi:hypothetical protein
LFANHQNGKMSKHARTDGPDEPIEVHASGFMSPMVMFPTFPHNDTFIDNRIVEVRATPVSTTAEVYTLVHHKQEYGISKSTVGWLSVRSPTKIYILNEHLRYRVFSDFLHFLSACCAVNI